MAEFEKKGKTNAIDAKLGDGTMPGQAIVRKAGREDLEILANLAVLMWDKHSVEEMIAEFSEEIADGKSQFFLACVNDKPIGFAQCQLRHDYVEGTRTTPVGYLEGIFVKEGYRNQGRAKEMLLECEAWAKENGCQEFASDCEIGNAGSLHFHKVMNFTEANRIICFTKML